MKVKRLLPVMLVCLSLTVHGKTLGKDKSAKAGSKRQFKLTAKNDKDNVKKDSMGFPDTLQYGLEIDGLKVELDMERENRMTVPPAVVVDTHGKAKKKRDPVDNVAFYKDKNRNGVFACRSKGRNGRGKVECEMNGLVHINGANCYLGFNDAYGAVCGRLPDADAFNGPIDFDDDEADDKEEEGREMPVRRKKRYTPIPEIGYKVIQVAFLIDRAAMETFYLHYYQLDDAEEAAVYYITLLTVEINALFHSIEHRSDGKLDLYVYPSSVEFPSYWGDLELVEKSRTGEILDSVRLSPHFEEYLENLGNRETWDHVMLLTGLRLYSSAKEASLGGYAFYKTMCSTGNKRFSAVRDTGGYTAKVAAHELGHALGAKHNSGHCALAKYIMGGDKRYRSTYYSFSRCTVRAITEHLESRPDCLGLDGGLTDGQFLKVFCEDMMGETDLGLAFQCKKTTGYADSEPCNYIRDDHGCFNERYIKCSTTSDGCYGPLKSLKLVWNGTPCGERDEKHCYLGRCVDPSYACWKDY